MGGCLTRLKAEMKAPPPQSGNWQSFNPQRPEPYIPDEHKQGERHDQRRKQMKEGGNNNGGSNGDHGNGAPLRETPSGIPGLTYDWSGRPVYVMSSP